MQVDAVMGVASALCSCSGAAIDGEEASCGPSLTLALQGLCLDSAAAARMVFCGDLNSTPETAVIEYLEGGSAGSGHQVPIPLLLTALSQLTSRLLAPLQVWLGINAFRWGAREEEEGEEEGEGDGAGRAACDDACASQLPLPALSHPRRMKVGRSRDARSQRVAPLTASRLPCVCKSAAGYPQYTNFTSGFRDLLDYVFVETAARVARVAPFPGEQELREHTALPSRFV